MSWTISATRPNAEYLSIVFPIWDGTYIHRYLPAKSTRWTWFVTTCSKSGPFLYVRYSVQMAWLRLLLRLDPVVPIARRRSPSHNKSTSPISSVTSTRVRSKINSNLYLKILLFTPKFRVKREYSAIVFVLVAKLIQLYVIPWGLVEVCKIRCTVKHCSRSVRRKMQSRSAPKGGLWSQGLTRTTYMSMGGTAFLNRVRKTWYLKWKTNEREGRMVRIKPWTCGPFWGCSRSLSGLSGVNKSRTFSR